MLVDTHSHLNFKTFDQERDEVIIRALKGGVFMINVGSSYETSKLAIKIAEKYEKGVYAAIALHPIHLKDEKFDYKKYKELAKSSKKVVAIGEAGLDAMYPNPKQEEVFLEHLKLAHELDLPVILHCRKAHSDLIKVLKSEIQDPHSKQKQEIRGVVHCFTGKWSEAKQYLEMGFYLGFNGIIFKHNVEESIKKVPLDRILIETDCPYLTPPMAGVERNEPLFVKYVAEKITELRGEPLEKIQEATTQNAKKLFILP